LVEAALVRLAAADKFVDAASLIERLEQLGSAPAAAARSAPAARPPAGRAPLRTGEKKKAVEPAAHEDEYIPTPAEAPLENPQWEQGYLRQHWTEVVAALTRNRAGQASGLLAPAQVLAVEGDVLRLGYDRAHETIRRRCVDRMNEQITSALGKLFGREVRCEYVSADSPGRSTPQPINTALSTTERAALNQDPAVKAVLDFFDGSVTNIRPQAPPPDRAEETEE